MNEPNHIGMRGIMMSCRHVTTQM